MTRTRSICLISLSPIYRDARVLRQITALSPHYHLTVIGFGPPPPEWNDAPHITWVEVTKPATPSCPPAPPAPAAPPQPPASLLATAKGMLPVAVKSPVRQLLNRLRQLKKKAKEWGFLIKYGVVGHILPTVYDPWYWRMYGYVFPYVRSVQCDAFLANDWETLPLVAEAAKQTFAPIVCDLHEYAPLRVEENRRWLWTVSPAIRAFLKRYRPFLSASITVGSLLAERYTREFQLTPLVVYNAPEYEDVPCREPQPDTIHLIHHGIAQRARHLETMIEALTMCDTRYTLHFMLVDHDPGYLEMLQQLAENQAPGRVVFHEAVRPTRIIQTIAAYDMGFYVLKPVNFNTFAAMPNKFFDFIVAGLAICIGPSPAMAEIVNQYGVGCVAPSFEPHDIARTLNALTLEDIQAMRRASREAAKVFNAEQEMGKVVRLYQNLFAEHDIR
jgi:glycosyltransferase involved in cell wall biosynthesis